MLDTDALALGWTALHGVEVTFTSRGQQAWTGLVLRPTSDTPQGCVRVHVTARGDQATSPDDICIEIVNPNTWSPAPTPEQFERRYAPSRKPTRDRGLPLYRAGEASDLALATHKQLKVRFRREVAPGQTPIAMLQSSRGVNDRLYAVAEAIEMAPLSEKRQATWDALRRCAGPCTHRSLEPLPEDSEGERYCRSCLQARANERWDAVHLELQQSASQWAREVLADPTAMVVFATCDWQMFASLFLARLDGTVLLDLADVFIESDHFFVSSTVRDRAARCTALEEHGETLRGLADQRLVPWVGSMHPDFVARWLRARNVDPITDWVPADGDNFRDRIAHWLMLPRDSSHALRGQASTTIGWIPPNDLHERFTVMRQLLTEMAAGTPTPERRDEARARWDAASHLERMGHEICRTD